MDLFPIAHDDTDGTGIGDDQERLEILAGYLRSGEESIRKGSMDDGYTYYIVNEVVPFSHIFVNHPVSSADPRSSIRNLIH